MTRAGGLGLLLLGLGAAGCLTIAGLDGDYRLGPGATGGSGGSGAAAGATGTGGLGAAGSGATAGQGGAPGGAAGMGGSAGAGGDPLAEVAAALDGERWELPCEGAPSPPACPASNMTRTKQVGGTPGASYLVTVRVRGVVEQNTYVGGTPNGTFYVGGAPDNPGWNIYRLDVSSPAQHYYFNSGQQGILYCHAIDYQVDIPIDGGALLTLVADALDGQQVQNVDENGTPIVVPGVPPDPLPYDGQFIQTDVLTVVPN